MILLLLISLWLWDPPTCDPPDYYRVEFVWLHQIASIPGMDDGGNVIPMPIYNPWSPVLVQEGVQTEAMVPCDPSVGEVCAIIVTGFDTAQNPDDGRTCE